MFNRILVVKYDGGEVGAIRNTVQSNRKVNKKPRNGIESDAENRF